MEKQNAPQPKYGAGSLIFSGLAIAAILAMVVYAKMEDDRIYGPVRESRARVEQAEQNLIDVERQVAMDTLQHRAEANLARINGEEAPAQTGAVGQRRSMSMQGCVATIAGTAEAIGVSPRMEINDPDQRVAVFTMPDGTIRITCADGEQIVTHAPR